MLHTITPGNPPTTNPKAESKNLLMNISTTSSTSSGSTLEGSSVRGRNRKIK